MKNIQQNRKKEPMEPKMKRNHLIKHLALLSLILVTGINAASKVEVEIEDFAFVPQQITILQGDTVEWKNRDNMGHTSTSGSPGEPNGLWDSGIISKDQTFSYVFDTSGTFNYYCKPHPWMTGVVTVNPKPDTGDTVVVGVTEKYGQTLSILDAGNSYITVYLPEAGYVSLILYDASGREISLVAQGNYVAGLYKISKPEVKSGVYFIRLVTGKLAVTRKIIEI